MTQPRRSTMREIRSILENQEYQITELRADTVQLLSFRPWLTQSSGPKVGNGLRRCCARMPATRPSPEFLPINPDTADQDLRDVLAHGLIGAPDKAEISELLRSGESPTLKLPSG